MADMEERIALNFLLDFYGPLLTPHRQELLRLYCEEDLSQQEIADQMEITRQGVFDAMNKAKRQLADYEKKLGLVKRYRMITAEAEKCLEALESIKCAEGDVPAMNKAKQSLENILRIER